MLMNNLLRSMIGRYRGQSNNWQQNLNYNAPRVFRSVWSDLLFAAVAVALAVLFVIAGAYEFIFASPLSAVFGGAADTVLKATPAEVGSGIMNLPQTDIANKNVGDLLGGVSSGVAPLLGALAGLFDEIAGVLVVVAAVVVRFSHRLLGLLVGNRPASQKGSLFSWIILGGAALIFIFGVLV